MKFNIIYNDPTICLALSRRELRILTSAVGAMSVDIAEKQKHTRGLNITMSSDLSPLYESLSKAVQAVEE